MNPLPAPQQVRAVLSFDFDGTIHNPAERPPVPREFFEEIQRIRNQYDAIWGINTGRSLGHLIEGFIDGGFPFLPDWVVVRECEIHTPNSFGRWIPHDSWNKRMHRNTNQLFRKSRKLLDRIRNEIGEHTGAHWMDAAGEPAGLVSRTEEEMEWIVVRVAELCADTPALSWQRNSIYLRFCHRDYHKGSCLGEVARCHNVPTSRCFAIGDSHNDLAMLRPDAAGMIACPANAVMEIHRAVESVGGHITALAHGQGTIEALRRYFP